MKHFMIAVALMGAVALAPRAVQAQGMTMGEKDIVETAVAAGRRQGRRDPQTRPRRSCIGGAVALLVTAR